MSTPHSEHYYVLHAFPDADAIGSTWLATRELFPRLFPGKDLKPYFMRASSIDPDIIAGAAAVFDVGGEYDPSRLRFDHHQLADPRSICATRMVWEYLTKGDEHHVALCPELTYLHPTIDLIEAGDTDRIYEPPYRISLTAGLHALLAGFEKSQVEHLGASQALSAADESALLEMRDKAILEYGWQLLDTMALNLRYQYEVAALLPERVVYKSKDGLVWGLDNAPPGSAVAAYNEGARLIIASHKSTLPASNAIEIFCTSQTPNLDLRDLVRRAEQDAQQRGNTAMYEELRRLYREKSYAGRGRATRAPDPTPLTIDVARLASLMDRLWKR